MRIVNSLIEDFHNFELDADAIDLTSASESKILLPYCGSLPMQFALASSVHIQIIIQVTQPVRIVLVAKGVNGKTIRRGLYADTDEIISLMDRFFEQEKDCGLIPYWKGVWCEAYLTWRQIIKEPESLNNFFNDLSKEQQAELIELLIENTKQKI